MSVARDYKLGKIKNNYNQDDLNWYLNKALEDKEYLENYIEQQENGVRDDFLPAALGGGTRES